MVIERPKAVKYWSIGLGIFLAVGLVARLATKPPSIAPEGAFDPLWLSLLLFAVQGVGVFGLWMMRKWGPALLVTVWLLQTISSWMFFKGVGLPASPLVALVSTAVFVAFFVLTIRPHWSKMSWALLPPSARAGGA